eukprot:g8362.t1
MFVRTKKKIASKLSTTKSVQHFILRLLGEQGESALAALMQVVENFDGEETMKSMKADICKLIMKIGMIHNDHLVDEVKTRDRLEKPVARLFELMLHGTMEVSSAKQLQQVEDMKVIAKGGTLKASSGRRLSMTSNENRDVALRRSISRAVGKSIDAKEIPEDAVIYKSQIALGKVAILVDAVLTRHMTEKNRGKIKQIVEQLKRKDFLTFFFDSPICVEERNTLFHALEEWYSLAGFVQSEESKREERKLWQLKYEKIEKTLCMSEFLHQPKYQNYLIVYLKEEHQSLADAVNLWTSVERFKDTSSHSTLVSRAPGLFKKFIQGKETGIDDEEMQIIAKNIEEGNISRNMFDNGLNQIIGKLDPLFDDFKKSKSFGNFKTEVFRFTKEDA